MATFTGTELLQVAPGLPLAVRVVDDRWIVAVDAGRGTPTGALPLTGTFSVMDTTTSTAKVYSGLPNTAWLTSIDTNVSFTNRLCAHDGYAWFVSQSQLYRITPSNGNITAITLAEGVTNAKSVVGVGSRILVGRAGSGLQVYDASTMAHISTGTFAMTANTMVPVGTDRVVVGWGGTGTIIIIDDSANVIAMRYRGTSGGDKGTGFAIGRRAYMPSIVGALAIIDVDTAVILTTGTDPGIGGVTGVNLGHDGFAYMFGSTAGVLAAVSTVSGATEVVTLPTSRARRYQCVSARGQLWIPSGDPYS